MDYSLREVAVACDVKVRTVREWIRKGKIQGYKVENSRHWRFAEDELNRVRGARNENKIGEYSSRIEGCK